MPVSKRSPLRAELNLYVRHDFLESSGIHERDYLSLLYPVHNGSYMPSPLQRHRLPHAALPTVYPRLQQIERYSLDEVEELLDPVCDGFEFSTKGHESPVTSGFVTTESTPAS